MISKVESHTKVLHIMRSIIITTIDHIHALEYSCNELGVIHPALLDQRQ